MLKAVPIILLLSFTGCASMVPYGVGAATGVAATNAWDVARKELDEKQQVLLQEQASIVERMAASNDDAEKTMLEAQNAALKKKIDIASIAQEGMTVIDKIATKGDWSNPLEYGPWLVSVLATAMAGIYGKRRTLAIKALNAEKEGVEKFKAQAEPAIAEKLYLDIKERKEMNGL